MCLKCPPRSRSTYDSAVETEAIATSSSLAKFQTHLSHLFIAAPVPASRKKNLKNGGTIPEDYSISLEIEEACESFRSIPHREC